MITNWEDLTMGMNVSSIASSYYENYLYKSQNSDKVSADSSAVSEESYNVSDITSALDMMASATENGGLYTTNLDKYVSNVYMLSQLSVHSALSSLLDNSGNSLYSAGSLNRIGSNLCTAYKLGLLSDSSDPFDPYSILGVSSTASTSKAAEILKDIDTGDLSNYQKSISDAFSGTFDVSA